MDIRGLYNLILGYVDGGVLTLPMGAIPSDPINSIFREFMNGGPLVLGNADPKLNTGANIITISNTDGRSFPLQDTKVEAVFTIIDTVPQMELTAFLPAGRGSLTKPFPKLKKTLFDTLSFSDSTVLSLNSYAVAPSRPRGLSLDGAVLLTGDLFSIRVLFNSDRLRIGGPMTLTSDIPVFAWTSSDENTLRIPNFGELMMTFELANAAVDQSGTLVASAKMQVVSGIRYDTVAGRQVLRIYTPPPFGSNDILFQGDLTEALELGLAAVSQLADSANVQGLLPAQLPIPAIVQFRQWTMTLNTRDASIRTVSVNIRLNTEWEIITNLLRLDLVDFTFTYSTLGTTPLSMAAMAVIALGEEPDLGIIRIYAGYPGFRFSGSLDPGTKISLNTLVRRFIGADAAAIITVPLDVTELAFSVDPANTNFSILVGITTNWPFAIGGVDFTFRSIRGSISYVASKVSGFISAAFQVLEDDNAFVLEVTAGYTDAATGWYFISRLKEGTINLGKLIAYYAPPLSFFSVEGLVVTALEVRIQTGTNQSYGFTIDVKWDISSGGANIAVLGAHVQLDSVMKSGVRTYAGIISGTAEFFGVRMSATVDMSVTPTKYTFTLWDAEATLQGGVVKFTLPNRSLGEIIELLVNAAFPNAGITLPPPFTVLNAIRLNNFEFEFNFNTNISKIRYPRTGNLGLDFGFMAINQFEMSYDGTTKIVELKVSSGRFLDQNITPANPKCFNVADPNAMANQVPGQGDKLFKLHFLGLGQHVSPKTPIAPGATIATVVNQLEAAFKKPAPPALPPVPPPFPPTTPVSPIVGTELKFDDGANWIIAGDIVILSTVTIKAVFLDPQLYGVSIGVQGPKGGNFNGLAFDILYRRVNDNVGVYQIELKLPDAFRQLEFGAVTITLPIIKLEIFTNGDFRVDLGFPANDDFSRSFGVQMLPFTGSGGIYFGVLSSATSTKVPSVQNCGQFSPVLELGVGLRIGIGKDINKGILKAGLSLTLQGIVEGVIAWYSPYGGTGDKDFFYSVRGKFAIVGNLYGEINFAIISARLDILVTIGVTFSVQIYEPTKFGFFASVRVSLTVKINLGIFKISISLSFQASIQESFTIGRKKPAPWDCKLTSAQRKQIEGSLPLGSTPVDEDQCLVIPQLVWQPILLDGAPRRRVEIVGLAQLTAASVIDPDGNPLDAKPRAVASLYSRTTPFDPEEEAPFFVLAKGIFLWGLNAYLFREQSGVTLAQLLAATVTAEDLQAAYCGMLGLAPGSVEPFTPEELDKFVSGFFELDLSVAQEQENPVSVSAVPMVPAIVMTRPDGTTVDFTTYNETSTEVLAAIKEYFRQLQARAVQSESRSNAAPDVTMSMATFLWMDFFAMIAREAMQSAIDTLKGATLVSTGSESLRDLVETLPLLGRSIRDVARANLTRSLQPGVTLLLPQSRRRRTNAGSAKTSNQLSTLIAIARVHDLDPVELAILNSDVAGLFAPGRLLVPNAEALTVQQLLDMMDEQQQFDNLSGLAARVLLAGLRPPYPDGTGDDPLQALYDLSGQQFVATGINTTDPVTLAVPAADWIKAPDGKLEIFFNDTEVGIAEAYENIVLLPTFEEPPHAEKLYRIEPKRFTLANPIEWSTAVSSIWLFPDNLQTLITGEHALQPVVEIIEEGQDAPNRVAYEVNELLGEIPHVWTTTIPLVVRRIPSAVDPNLPIAFTYDLRGTNQSGGLLLQNLLSWWEANGKPDIVKSIEILYPPDPAVENPPNGLVSMPVADTSMFVLQTNLSTVSNPGAVSARAKLLAAAAGGLVGQTAIEFLRLIWECSIVRSGGYDFYYKASGAGLPEYLFEQETDITLTVVVSYNINDNRLQSFLNAVVLDQPADPDSESVYFIRPVTVIVPQSMIADDATLDALARRHHATAAEIAALNADRMLRAARPITIPASSFIVREGSTTGLARQLGVEESVLASGAAIRGGTIVSLPERVLQTANGDTLALLAARHGTSVSAIATANRHARYFFISTPTVEDQLVERIVQIPQGNVAWSALRISPDAPPLARGAAIPDETAEQGLQELYNLIEFMIVGTPSFNETDWSLPAGPAKDDVPPSDPNTDRNALLAADAETGLWPYRSVLPVARFSTAALPVVPPDAGGPALEDDPYRGVGTDVLLDLEYLDMFGNRVKTNGGQPTLLPIPIRYFDDLMPLDEWAGSGSDYTITGDGTAPATLTVTLSFDTSPYLTPPDGGADPVELALAVEQKYAKAFYQLIQPDVIVALNATSDTSVETNTPNAKDTLIRYLGSVYDFLHAIATGGTPVAPEPRDFTRTVAANNPLDLFELVIGVTIARTKYIDPDLDDPTFLAVRTVTTVVQANYTEPATQNEGDLREPLTLNEFATLLQTAFPGMKVAVGTPETGSDGAPRPREVWLLRMGESDGVWYTIDKAAPYFYAVAPISRAPQSDDAEIYPYFPGKFIGDSTPSQQSFSNVDLEVLAQELLAAIEQFLSPDYIVPAWNILIAQGYEQPNAINEILEAKKILAAKIAGSLAPVLAGSAPPPDALTDAIASVEQQLLINLTNAYSIDTVLQYRVAVTSDFIDPVKSPRFYGKPLMPGLTQEQQQNFSLTTTRFSMQNGSRYLTFSFGTRSDAEAAVVDLPLRLGITNIEQPLDTVPGIPDYRPSSWLTFALDFSQDSGGRDDLGIPEIPVPLRAYPTPPSMVAQNGVPLLAPAGAPGASDDLDKARAWLYNFAYEYPPADQDTVYATVVFQSGSMNAKAAAVGELTLFDTLVQFSAVYRQILADFNRTLLVPGGDPNIAVNAIRSFAWVITRAAAAWNVRTQAPLMASDAVGTSTTTEVALKESATQYGGIDGVLLITLTPVVGTGIPAVTIDGYDTVPVGDTGRQFVFTSQQTGLPLMRVSAMQLPRRTLTYGGLDVLIEESALSGTHVRRNESFDGKPANDIFIYQTPEIRFFTPLTPVLEPDIEIDIAQYTTPLPAELYDLLRNFLFALFEGAPVGSTHTLRLGARFSYPLQQSVPLDPMRDFPVSLPILLTGPVPVQSNTDLDALARGVADFALAWFASNGITGKFGVLWFEASLYAGEATMQLPTLRLNRLRLDSTQVMWR
jgi:hypothetical protein